MSVYCCEKARNARGFVLEPKKGYVYCKANFLKSCPKCANAVLEIERIDAGGAHSVIRYKGSRAERTFRALNKSILFELEAFSVPKSGFYFNYNEFGRKKRCYSNLSALKCGIFESLELPEYSGFQGLKIKNFRAKTEIKSEK